MTQPNENAPTLQELQALAKQGDAAAQCELGLRYANGIDTEKDLAITTSPCQQSRAMPVASAPWAYGTRRAMMASPTPSKHTFGFASPPSRDLPSPKDA